MKIIGNYSIFFGLNRRQTFLTLSASGPLASEGVFSPALLCLCASINCFNFSGNPLFFAALFRASVNIFADRGGRIASPYFFVTMKYPGTTYETSNLRLTFF
ncbi:MAG: hypothetical protein ACLQBD_05185 [Syntrophobacteraceae bacterium]